MSKVEILNELPKLTMEERQEARELLAELDGEDWLDDDELRTRRSPLLIHGSTNATARRMRSSLGSRQKPG